MFKKIIALGVLAVMVLSFAACGQDDELVEYKAVAKTAIETYAANKSQNNYSTENWTVLCGIVTTGKTAVDEAENKAGVDLAVAIAKEEIDKVGNKLKLGFYNTDDGVGSIRLYGDNLFSFNIVYISHLPTGTYSIADGKLVLSYTDVKELLFEIGDEQLILIGANIEGIFVEDGSVKVGTIFRYSESSVQELKQGTYITDDGFSSVTLFDDNKYIFNRHIGTSYRPTGSYATAKGKLTLYIEDKAEFVFDIVDEQLVFARGHLAESLVEVGTIFKLSN